MAERDRPVYCTQCGSIVQPGNNCGVCGARMSPNAQATGPTLEIPRQYPPPRKVPAGARGGAPALIVGLGVVVVLLLGVGTIFGLALLGRVGVRKRAGAPAGSLRNEGRERRTRKKRRRTPRSPPKRKTFA